MLGAIVFSEDGALVVVEFDGPVVAVQERVVPAAQQQPVAQAGMPAVLPWLAVVDVAVMDGRIATRGNGSARRGG